MEPVHVRAGGAPSWSPRPVETAAAGVGVGFATALAFRADPTGRVLFGVAAVWLLVVVAMDLVFRPRLRADAGGVEVRTPAVRRRLSWSAVARVTVDERNRFGLAARTLELDAGDTLVVLGRRALGADPRDVLPVLDRLRSG